MEDHDTDVLEMKAKTEAMWKTSTSKRERRSVASKDVPGICFFGDNIGNKTMCFNPVQASLFEKLFSDFFGPLKGHLQMLSMLF